MFSSFANVNSSLWVIRIILWLLFWVAFASPDLLAQTSYTVNVLTDNNPGGGGLGTGTTGDLRYALTQSNANPSAIASEPNEIVFSVSGQVNLAGALPLISAAVAIQGHENGNTINRSTGGNYRLLYIEVNAQFVYLSRLTFQNGVADFGGAIRNEGAFLDIYDCKFLNNRATNSGGAILNTTPNSLEMGFTLFQGNIASNQGGAILTDGYNAWFNNAFIDNSAEQGGAVFIGNSGQGEISNTTFSGNQANQNGSAGIKQGGAIYNDGAIRLLNCTVTLNVASAGQGGGVYNSANSFDLSLQNNIIAENTTGGDLKNDGFIAENEKNLVMNCNSCGITWFSTADPALLALQANGGFTPTHALDAASPAINQGAKPAPIDDQRGFVRVGLPDLGAYEFAAPLDGGRGTAPNLDGTDDYAHTFVPLMADRDDNFTIEVWVKLTATPAGNAVVVYNGTKGTNGYGIIINNAHQAVFHVNNTVLGTFGEVPLDKWTHLAITRFNTDYKGFLNGVATNLTSANEPIFPTSGFYVGGLPNGERFEGQIDEVRVWADYKTQDDMRSKMHLTLSGNEDWLTHYYQFNDAGGSKDYVGGRNLILVNGLTTTVSEAPVELATKVDVLPHLVNTPNSTTETVGNLEINWGTVTPNGQIVVSYVQEQPINSPGFAFGSGYWIINNFGTNQTFSPISLKFRFPDEVELDTDVSKYILHKRPSTETAEWQEIKHGAEGITVRVSNTPGDKYIEFAANASNTQLISFSQFVITNDGTPLGIRLLRFEAHRQDEQHVALYWETATEANNRGFHIQMSETGGEFINIGWQEGAGNSQSLHYYNYVIQQGRAAYYRLLQEDYDGKISLSPVVFVSGSEQLQLYPNPSAGSATLKWGVLAEGQSLGLEVRDVQGQVHLQVRGSLAQVNAALSQKLAALPAGYYLIQVQAGPEMQVRKFLKL
ncbi:MAG: T9SS type A sorting domain-containing protein [Microscillaceae bacterium]|nr:T9SS type A sorting domain-containing protein [Microscillaceae bacterium]